MRVIEQNEFIQLKAEVLSKDFMPFLTINQDGNSLCLDKTGAKQLFKVLQEFVDEESN